MSGYVSPDLEKLFNNRRTLEQARKEIEEKREKKDG